MTTNTNVVCFLLLLLSIPTVGCRGRVAIPVSLPCSAAKTLCVNATAGDTQEYSTIQAAVDDAQPGDTVLVFDGTYRGFTVSQDGTSSNRIAVRAEGRSALINRDLLPDFAPVRK
jgi:pectin methylesterase-like acyl-CoA thioesterase